MSGAQLRTEVTPVSQTACDDYALPEVPRHVANFADDQAKKQAEDAVDKRDQECGPNRRRIVLGECRNDVGEDQSGERKV